MTKTLPASLTSYDLLKAFAVITMVVDHVGFYFFPDDDVWRVIGRLSFPVWFFLIGYATSRDLPAKLWIGATILVLANPVVGLPVLALNALWTIIAIRLVLDRVMAMIGHSIHTLAAAAVIMLLLALPTALISEYGTAGLLFAVFGYAMRRRETFLPDAGPGWPFGLMAGCIIGYCVFQQLMFGFPSPAFLAMGTGLALLGLILMGFRGRELTGLNARIPGVLKAPLQFMGRHTLEIYVIHLLVFKGLAAYLDPQTYRLFDFRFF